MSQTRWHFAFVTRRLGWLSGAIIFHFVLGLISALQLLEINSSPYWQSPTVGDGLFLAFAGPPLGGNSLTSFIGWVLSEVFFLVLVGDLSERQLGGSDYLIVLRVGSRRIWWLGLVTTILLTATGYVTVIVVAALAGAATQLMWYTGPSPFFAEQGIWHAASTMSLAQIMVTIGALTISSLGTAGLVQTLVALRARRGIWGMFTVVVLLLIAGMIGWGESVQSWQQWLPGTQSILSRHWPFEPRLPTFTASMSLAYNAVLFFSSVLAGLLALRTTDFMGSQDGNQGY